MDWVVAAGSLCLGIVIGYLVRYFIRRFQKFTPAALTSVVSILVGGAVAKFFQTSDQAAWALWLYPVGLLLGFAIYTAVVLMAYKQRWPKDVRGELTFEE